MNCKTYAITIMLAVAASALSAPRAIAHDDPVVRFDLPPVAAARPADADPYDPTLVTVELQLSSMIEVPEVPRIDQWLIRCQPRDNDVGIADYAPRTETASDLASPIQVKQTEEKSNSLGLALDASYGHIAHGNAGSDHTQKNINSVQFDRVAPEQTVTASGTINRGRGVYFKLRWTAQQILEGEKTFSLTLKVPSAWRGSLLDVSVIAQSERKKFAGWDRESKTIGSANFVVAVYRQGDHEAAACARALSDAEDAIRSFAAEIHGTSNVKSLPSMLRQVAVKLDLEPSAADQDWLQRLLLERADPHLDKEIRKLPMSLRLAVLDYADVRDQFRTMSDDEPQRVVVAKPPQ